jgi:hypothetical protein
MRYLPLGLLLLFASTLAACSFSTDFIVINASDQPIEVGYKIGATGIEPLDVTGRPATVMAAQLRSSEKREWTYTQYVFDREKRTVTVSLMPSLALRITRWGEWRGDKTVANFILTEVNITRENGEITLKGDQVYKSLVPQPGPFFSFGPPTL